MNLSNVTVQIQIENTSELEKLLQKSAHQSKQLQETLKEIERFQLKTTTT